MNKDDKYIWRNLMESYEIPKTGVITQRIYRVNDNLKDISVSADDSLYHTEEKWNGYIDQTDGFVDPEDGEGVWRYSTRERDYEILLPGVVVKHTSDSGWQVVDRADADYTDNLPLAVVKRNADVFLGMSDLEKHGYVEIMASSDVARRSLRSLR